MSIIFICAVLDCGRIIHHLAIKNESRIPSNGHPKHVYAPSRHGRAAMVARSCEAHGRPNGSASEIRSTTRRTLGERDVGLLAVSKP
jgi:hypothetical protein